MASAKEPSEGVDLALYRPIARAAARPVLEGRLSEAVGLVLEARGCQAAIGDLFQVRPSRGPAVEAEVVGVRGERTLLMPFGETHGLDVGSPLRRIGRADFVSVGGALLGRVVDGLGRPLDGLPPPRLEEERPLHARPPSPLHRRPVDRPFFVGVRALDGLLTFGRGQRVGIFAGGGVGKSSLLAMMVRHAEADVAVVALIGERGREVEEFVHRILGEEGIRRSVVVVATSADPPLLRVRASLYATAVAEHFRARGHNVLLLMDSLTRFAMAMREVGLAVGEPPTTKGYTPTVFASLPRLLERAGTSAGRGAITGVYTVLVEGDDLADPIADAVRAILDGHIVLSRSLAERGHFPAIDVPASVSRVMGQVVDPLWVRRALRVKEMLALAREAEDLLTVGAYQRGARPELDEALDRLPELYRFLRQRVEEHTGPQDVQRWLVELTGEEGGS